MGKQSQKTTTKTVYGNTTTSNPYVVAKTNNSGTKSAFQAGNALETIYNSVNNNIGSLLDEYLNPTLNSAVNRAKINSFNNALSASTKNNLENSIINPLSNRNMIRSSQATGLYKNLSNQNAASLEDYVSDLISQSQDNSSKMINDLLGMYMNGYNVLNNAEARSLQSSMGNATKTSQTTSKQSMLSQIIQIAKALSDLTA